jgi:1-acyl-sn-glycerol-3-phosphate acyltransferase
MRYLVGLLRIALMVVVLVLTTLFILLLAPFSVRVRGAKLCVWPATLLARSLLFLLDVKLYVKDRKRVVQHRGFLFPNHVSFLDILALLALMPVRFLGKIQVRSWPFIGWIATAIDTVFVERADKESRGQARAALRDLAHYPPIGLFPEGGIHPTGMLLNPFRWGAFEIAIHSQIPYLPCVFVYDQRELVFWGDESLMAVVWRLASRRTGTIRADLIPLRVVDPAPDDDAKQLAAEAHGAILSVLTYHHGGEEVVQEGI